MNTDDWQEFDVIDEEELNTLANSNKAKGKERKRKWREIEAIKEQRRLRRDLADFEQYSYN